MNFAWRIYRRLARAFPHEFKLAYGAEMMQLGEDVVKEIARRHGVPGLIRLVADIAIRLPIEYLSEMRSDMRYGLRTLINSPGFALVGILSMGLGMGLTTLVYNSKVLRPPADGITVMVRSDGGMDALGGIRREIASIDPNLVIFNVRTLREYLERSRSSERFAVNTYGGIGLFGLVLAAIGLAGVTAYSVAQRSKEIGIRMALGARKRQVLLLVLREGAALVGVGAVLGFSGAYALAKMLSSLTSVFVDSLKIGTSDPRLLVGAPLLLAGLALLACYAPARRAAKVDPLKALPEE